MGKVKRMVARQRVEAFPDPNATVEVKLGECTNAVFLKAVPTVSDDRRIAAIRSDPDKDVATQMLEILLVYVRDWDFTYPGSTQRVPVSSDSFDEMSRPVFNEILGKVLEHDASFNRSLGDDAGGDGAPDPPRTPTSRRS